jgi:PAS domain S-box-containing protein
VTDARVLVVATSATIPDSWGDQLGRAGYNACSVVTSVREALDAIRERIPDVVLIELDGAVGLDGVEVARQIRNRHALPLLYAVEVANDGLLQIALDSKPDGFVFDPSRPQQLRAAIELALRNHRRGLGAGNQAESLMQFNEELHVVQEELQQHVEELQVNEEELRSQNIQLLAAEEELSAERRRYLDLFEFAPDGYVVTDLDGTILEANRAAGQLLGRQERYLVNKPLILSVAERDQEHFLREMTRAQGAREPVQWETRLKTGAGHHFQAAVTVGAGSAWDKGQGERERPILRWLIRDITQRVEATEERERLLAENRSQREFLERLVQSAPVGIGVVYGSDHRLELCNSAFQSLPGFEGRVTLDEPMSDIISRTSPAILDLVHRVYRLGNVVSLHDEEVVPGPAGEAVYLDVEGIPLPGRDGRVERVLLLVNQVTGQVTARHQIEELAARAEQRAEELDAVFAAMADAVVVYDTDARATRANDAAVAFYGLDPVGVKHVELAHKLAIRLLDGQAAAIEDLPVPRALQGEAVQGLRLLFRDAAGQEHVVRASAGPVGVGGRRTGAVATWHDITEELGVQQARDRLLAILEATPDMVFIASPGGKLLYMNDAARRARGLDNDASLDGLTLQEVVPASASALVEQEAIPTAMRDGIGRGHAAIVDAGGREIPVSSVLVAQRGPDGQVEYLSSIARDITERQAILSELAEERARLRAVIDNAPVAIVVADAEGRVVLANPAAERLYARPLPYGQKYDSLASLGLRHPDGSPFDPRHLPITRSAMNGVTLSDAALRITWPGGQQRDLIANSAAIHDAEGRVTGSVSIFRDVTEQVHAEENLRRFSERLKILYEIDQAILAAQTPEEIFPPVLERLARLIPCCHAGILLDVPEANELQLRLGDESGSHELVGGVGLTLADLGETAVRQVGDLEAIRFPSPLERLLQERGLRAYAGAPLVAANRLLGYLFIGSDEVNGLHKESIQIVGEVAHSLALAIQHDLLRADLIRHGDQLAASLREKDLMLQEIHHRVKNNLQIISSLLDMEATTISDPIVIQALQDSRNRVKTMALIHERLYQSSEVGSVPAPAYVRSITSYLFGVHRANSGPVELELKVEDVFLDINTAIPLGLILNELVSNALKYAFGERDAGRGRLRIELSQSDSHLVLQVRDNGSGLPQDVNWQVPRTLGLRLVRVLTEQLRGSLELDRQDGTAFRIVFPCPDQKPREDRL